MKVLDVLSKANPNPRSEEFRHLERIKAGNYVLSIQASSGHYCTPRETLNNLSLYGSMELAIFNENGWFNFRKSKVFRDFPRYAELDSIGDHGGAIVFPYIPVDLINDLYLYLEGMDYEEYEL